jgi:RNA polymerase sigma factor (sigma-70 family)
MSAFPDTPVSLLARIAAERTGASEASWTRFFELYQPVIVKFAAFSGAGREAEDVAQDVFVKLVGILRAGAYDPAKSKFRTYLSTLARRILIDRYREVARRQSRNVGLEAASDIAFESDPGEWMDAKWRVACRMAAERRVMEESAISEQSRALWRLLSAEGIPVKEAAKRLGIPANTASKIKRRMETRMLALVRMYEKEIGKGLA